MTTCADCGETLKKHGKTRDGQQRFRCTGCGKTSSDAKPLAGLATEISKAAQALSMLLEGMSIRATSRMTGLAKDTVQRLVERAGEQCLQFMADTMKDVPAGDIQCDEIWSFVGAKEKTAVLNSLPMDAGDCYTFTALDRNSKLLICFHVGKRSSEDTNTFAAKLALCIKGRPHVSTDGYTPYQFAIPHYFSYEVDHGILVKQYGIANAGDARRYSPAAIIGIKERQNCGTSEPGQTCTSHIERSNLTIRMQNRRFTRLTNAFSKKWTNHEAMFALFAAWYNFCRKHQTVKTTPAVAAGIAAEPWTLERLLTESAKTVAA